MRNRVARQAGIVIPPRLARSPAPHRAMLPPGSGVVAVRQAPAACCSLASTSIGDPLGDGARGRVFRAGDAHETVHPAGRVLRMIADALVTLERHAAVACLRPPARYPDARA